MASLGAVQLKGNSGQEYQFRAYPLGTRFRKMSGVYAVAVRSPGAGGRHRLTILFVGRTRDFSRPFEKHPKAREFAQRGANCICLLSDESRESRRDKNRDLIAALKPECND